MSLNKVFAVVDVHLDFDCVMGGRCIALFPTEQEAELFVKDWKQASPEERAKAGYTYHWNWFIMEVNGCTLT